jgi:hypothetical protein
VEKEALHNMNGDFTSATVLEFIKSKHPELYSRAAPRTIAARIWEAASEGVIERVSIGKGGQPNIYKRV